MKYKPNTPSNPQADPGLAIQMLVTHPAQIPLLHFTQSRD